MAVIKQLEGSALPDEYRRIARVLEIIQYIATRPGWWKRKTLAAAMSSRTPDPEEPDIIRHRLGLSLIHDGVGYSFERIPHLPAVQYTFSEALALLMAA